MKEPVKDLTAVIDRTLDVAIYHEDEMEITDVTDRCANAYKPIKHVEDVCIDMIKSSDYSGTEIEARLSTLADVCRGARNTIVRASESLDRARAVNEIENA